MDGGLGQQRNDGDCVDDCVCVICIIIIINYYCLYNFPVFLSSRNLVVTRRKCCYHARVLLPCASVEYNNNAFPIFYLAILNGTCFFRDREKK